jgi:CTP synthase
MQKLDPYLNVDPGTMNPFQHGEVFVTDDGAETDLDIGHYERFLDVNLEGRRQRDDRAGLLDASSPRSAAGSTSATRSRSSRTSPTRSRPGCGRWRPAAKDAPDVIITEIGGTVGDIESLPFLEAARQVRHEIGRDNCPSSCTSPWCPTSGRAGS